MPLTPGGIQRVSVDLNARAFFYWDTASHDVGETRADRDLAAHPGSPYDMASCMKTTIDIAGPILSAAKRAAARENTTVRALVEEGLRRVLRERNAREPFRLRRASFAGQGLRPELAEAGWDRLRDLSYEGRGA